MLNSHSLLCLVQSYLILFPKNKISGWNFLHTKWQRNIQYIFIKMYYFPLKCTNFPLKCTILTLKWTNVTKMYNCLTKMFNFLSEILTFLSLKYIIFTLNQMNKFHQTVQFVDWQHTVCSVWRWTGQLNKQRLLSNIKYQQKSGICGKFTEPLSVQKCPDNRIKRSI